MATWTDIPDEVLEPGKPIRSVDALALRDNPIAIAEGAAGAPRVTENAMDVNSINGDRIRVNSISNNRLSGVAANKLNTGNAERDWVLGRTAGASAGAIGTYAFCYLNASSNVNFGGTQPGSNLIASNAEGAGSFQFLSGSWRCMGASTKEAGESGRVTLWLRIS